MKCEDKIVKSTHSRSFQTVRRMREAWKRETYVRSQSFSSESAVKYLQDSNIPSPGRTRSFKCPTPGHNQIPTQCPAPPPPPQPRRHNIDRYIISGRSGHTHRTNFPGVRGSFTSVKVSRAIDTSIMIIGKEISQSVKCIQKTQTFRVYDEKPWQL